jgi:predicted house-cleaning noncanonical NTP pyrophosphatase (MazG superfamily)
MKKIIPLLALVMLFSCTKESLFEKSISEYVKTNFKDPSSYEKIEVKVLDTITVGDQVREEKSNYQEQIKDLRKTNEMNEKLGRSEVQEMMAKDNLEEIASIQNVISDRCKDTASTEMVYYKISHKYRANNSFGAKELYNDIVSMDKDYKITGSHALDE